ncbi:MAG: hypothetical protein NZ821_08555 [Gloeomargarita sp. SKYB31]|nr:hypothetical protein [Gloeomargarita sp. SKYB31]
MRHWLNRLPAVPQGWQIIQGGTPEHCVALENVVNPQAKVILVRGWYVHSGAYLCKHAQVIRRFFTPLPKYQQNIQRLVEPLKDKYDVLVGVHIRLGDYREWLGGVYVYPLQTWRILMERMVGLLTPKRVGFLICSDENLIPQGHHFSGLPVHWGTGHIIEDLYSLAECDYLIAAPSTYSGWASFYGQVPIYFLPSQEDIQAAISSLTLAQFHTLTEPYRTTTVASSRTGARTN